MTFYVENETETTLPFPIESITKEIIETVLKMEECPYETEVNLFITDNEGIRTYNRQFRGIDKETDVLSFPNIEYESPADFEVVKELEIAYQNPDTNEIILGDIILSIDKVISQSEEYGHSSKREFAFLIVHSMLHLLGYDHMEEADAVIMEAKQEQILQSLNIVRE